MPAPAQTRHSEPLAAIGKRDAGLAPANHTVAPRRREECPGVVGVVGGGRGRILGEAPVVLVDDNAARTVRCRPTRWV